MKWTTWTALALGLVVIMLSTSAYGDEVLLNGGGAMEGKIASVDENGIKVESDGKTVLVGPAQLDPHYYYNQWAKRVGDDAKARLKLGVYAFENGLFNQARSQYRKAQKLDPEVVKDFEENVIPRIKEGVAEKLLAQAQLAVKNKKWHDAERIAAKILTQLEDTKAAEQARNLISSVHINQVSNDEKRLVKRLARYLPKEEAASLREREKLGKRLAPIERKIDKARRRVVLGLQTRSQNRSKGIFVGAAKQYETILKDLGKLATAAAGEEGFLAYVDEVQGVAKREAIEAWIHAGNVYLIRGAFNDAMAAANRTLAIDPDSEVAKAFAARVEHSAQMRSGWWGRGRR